MSHLITSRSGQTWLHHKRVPWRKFDISQKQTLRDSDGDLQFHKVPKGVKICLQAADEQRLLAGSGKNGRVMRVEK
jgi:hypothetical protein